MGEEEILPMVCADGNEYPELCVVENIESGRVKRLRVALKVAPQIVNSRDKFFSTTPLMIAANSIQLDAAKCLIEMGALLDLRDKGGFNAMVWAARKGSVELIKYFLDMYDEYHDGKFPDVGSKHGCGWALCQPGASAANGALLAASVYGHIPIVKYLLYKRNADINCTDGRKITPLLLASYKGRHELVEFMVNETDADVHFKCGEGKDCLDWAKKKSWSKVVAVLEQDVRRRKIEKTVERDLESVIMLKDCIIGACGFSSHKYNISS
mmetsp:Transcript_18652/g.29649  ORF Transcript_18652/g.29649 Transcript_18652/m.29649 type:complete len:268 (-) Transcript_18652:205-1008(-)|eukprot:jgi/Bigna1/90731/estExt_fgenesh1_pg.C_780014